MAQRAQLAADDRSGGRLLSCPTLKYIIFKGVLAILDRQSCLKSY